MPTIKSKKTKPRIPPLKIENAQIIYRNFAGVGKLYNAKGLRNFHVVLDPDLAKQLERDGWNVKWPKPKEDREDRNPTLKVSVRFDNYPPMIVQITSRGKTNLDEDTVGVLDRAEIETVDLLITGSHYEMDDGKSGFKAYLNQMFVTLSETDLISKYSDVTSAKRRSSKDEE